MCTHLGGYALFCVHTDHVGRYEDDRMKRKQRIEYLLDELLIDYHVHSEDFHTTVIVLQKLISSKMRVAHLTVLNEVYGKGKIVIR